MKGYWTEEQSKSRIIEKKMGVKKNIKNESKVTNQHHSKQGKMTHIHHTETDSTLTNTCRVNGFALYPSFCSSLFKSSIKISKPETSPSFRYSRTRTTETPSPLGSVTDPDYLHNSDQHPRWISPGRLIGCGGSGFGCECDAAQEEGGSYL